MGKATAKLEVIIGGRKDGTLDKAVTQSYYSIERFASMTNSVTRTMINAYRAGVNVASAAIADIAETYTSFEQAMADTAAIAGASVGEVERMTEAAREAGRTTTITAEDSAKALGYMALAGWSVDDSIKGLLPVLRLAEATGADLQVTSDLVTDSLGAVGLGVEDLTKYMDMLVATNNNANTTAEMLMESLIKTGGAAVTLGASMDFNKNFGLDELMTAIGVLGSNGIKAEKAGTALNSILTRIGANPEAKKGLDSIGVSVYDAYGNFIGLEETLYAIGDAMKGLNDEEKMKALRLIAGTRYASQLSYLTASLQDGASIAESSWGRLDNEIENSIGDLDVMNATATDTLKAASARWISAVNDMKIGIGDTFGDDAKDLLNEFSAKMPAIIEMVDEFGNKHSFEIKDLIDKLGDFAEDGAEGLLNLVETVVDNRAAIWDIVKGLTVGQVAITGIANAARVFKTFQTLPTGLKQLTSIVGLLGLAYTTITLIKDSYEKAKQEMVDKSLEDHFGNIALSMEQVEEIAEKITNTGAIRGMTSALSELEKADSFAESMSDAIAEIDKYNWKVEVGLGLTKEDEENYKTAIDDYVQNANEYVEQQRYAVSINLAAGLNGNDSAAEIISNVDEWYSLNQQAMADLGTQLSQAVNDAFDDNILSPEEIDNITELQAKIAEVQAQLAQGRYDAQISLLNSKYDWTNLTPESFEALQQELGEDLASIKQTAEDSYVENYAAITAAYTNEDGSMKEGYEDAIAAIESSYRQNIGEAELKAANAQIEGITNAYSDDGIQDAIDAVKASLDADMATIAEGSYESIDFGTQLNNASINAQVAAKDVLGNKTEDLQELYDNLQPTLEQLLETEKKLQELGVDIPAEYEEAIEQIYSIGAAAGDTNAIYSLLGTQIQDNEDYTQLMAAAQGVGANVPQQIVDGMTTSENMSKLDDTTSYIRNYIKEGLENGTIDSTIMVNAQLVVDTNDSLNSIHRMSERAMNSFQLYEIPQPQQEAEWPGVPYAMPGYADGGIVEDKQMAWIAENGTEAVIPINNAERSKNLWLEAGSRMGLLGNSRDTALIAGLGSTTNNSSNVAIQFNPTVYASGNASSEEIQSGLRMSMQEFKTMMDDYMRENARTAFG